MREVEVKAVVGDGEDARRRLADAGATVAFAGTLHDRRYDRSERSLTARDAVLRLRVAEGGGPSRATLDFKGPAAVLDGYKVREETTSVVEDADAVHAILCASGFVVVREIDRDVETWELEGAAIRFERYPRMDLLVEIEGAPACIERAIAVLGIPRAAFTTEPLAAFVARFEGRTGERAAICRRELRGDRPWRVADA